VRGPLARGPRGRLGPARAVLHPGDEGRARRARRDRLLRRRGRTVGAADAAALRDLTLAAYRRVEELTRARGIILADTKLEFGRALDGPRRGEILLGDEVFTPDSSRFWPADTWSPGRAQPSFDKQYVRDWLTSPASGWDRHGDAPPPPLPDDVVERTRERYLEAYRRLTGTELP